MFQKQNHFQRFIRGLGLCAYVGIAALSFAAKKSAEDNASGAKPVEFSAKDVWNVDIYNDDSHKVLVIQDRKFTKSKRIELGLDVGTINASPFYTTYAFGAHGAYHLNEYFGIEGFFNSSSSSQTADADQIANFLIASGFASRKEFQEPKFFGGVNVIWSPIYGKFAFFRRSIIHFDIFGTAGVSMFSSKSNFTAAQGGKDQNMPGSLLGVGMRVFLSKHFSIRLDVKNNIYRQEYAPTTGSPGATLTRSNFTFTTGLSYLFGSGE